jgi:hypothetical protein
VAPSTTKSPDPDLCKPQDLLTVTAGAGRNPLKRRLDMRVLVSCCVAAMVISARMGAAIADENRGSWTVEHRHGIWTLSYKQIAFSNNQTITSELAFVCGQKDDHGIGGAILVPFDGTFDSDQDPIPVLIQKQSDGPERSDLSQKWANRHEFLLSQSPEDVADLITLLTDKSSDADTSVHFRFPSGINAGQVRSNHLVIDVEGFGAKFSEFENDCTSAP